MMEAELRDALVQDLDQLIRLHDRELDAEILAALKVAAYGAQSRLAAAPPRYSPVWRAWPLARRKTR